MLPSFLSWVEGFQLTINFWQGKITMSFQKYLGILILALVSGEKYDIKILNLFIYSLV